MLWKNTNEAFGQPNINFLYPDCNSNYMNLYISVKIHITVYQKKKMLTLLYDNLKIKRNNRIILEKGINQSIRNYGDAFVEGENFCYLNYIMGNSNMEMWWLVKVRREKWDDWDPVLSSWAWISHIKYSEQLISCYFGNCVIDMIRIRSNCISEFPYI